MIATAKTRWIYPVLVISTSLVIWLTPPGGISNDIRAAAAFLLLWVLPGWGWGNVLGNRWLVGIGTGMGLQVLLALLLSYLPGPIPFGLSLAVFTLAALLPFGWLLIHHRAPLRSCDIAVAAGARSSLHLLSSSHLPLLLVLLAAILFRFPNLGYSEFQGDEGTVMQRAAMVIEGNEEQFFLHQKGPAEILIPLTTWRLGGAINEFWARLPFAWLSLLSVAAVIVLGTRWLDGRAGWLAGLILAISGLQVAFARIVQNQSWVMFMGLAAWLALDEFRRDGQTKDLLLGALLLAVSVLGHYDAVLAFPVAAVLALRWTPGRSRRPLAILANRTYLYAIAVGLAVLALFYLPFAIHPNFAKTVGYLAEDRVGAGGGLHLNLEKLWGVSTLYNSTYYYVLLLLLACASLLAVRRYPLLLYPGLAFLAPFTFYLVLVQDPRTHIYTFYAGAALLAGATLSALWMSLAQARWRWALAAAGGAVYILCATYIWLLFVSHDPEYLRTFPAYKSPLYWTSYDRIFRQGLFGFPYRAGWHAIGGLVAEGRITGIYASNEEQEITDWYTRQAPRSHCPLPDVYIAAENVQDPIYIDRNEIERDYTLAGVVQVNGQDRIHWYTRSADSSIAPAEPLFVDERFYRQWWRPAEVVPRIEGWTHPADATLGDKVHLLGYDLDESHAAPGGWVRVTLYWQPLAPLRRNYQVFAHLYDGQKLWAQHDGAPECTINATTRWEPGQLIPDQHIIPLPPDTPVGPLPLLVGMYDLLTQERLPVPDTAHQAVPLAMVNIRASLNE